MPFTFNRQALAVLSCFVSAAASAQAPSAVPELDQIVVTASRMAQLQKDVIGDVTVIDKKELQKAGQDSIAETLARQPGVQFYNNGGPQTTTGVFLRGTSPAQTLVLVDGIRINSITSGATSWGAIDPAVIERIEIVRGAASSLYGSDAIGGVINIITKKSGEDRAPAAWANIGIGTYSTFKSSVGLSGAQDGWDYALSTSMAESNGFNASSPVSGSFNRDADGYSQHALSGSLGYRWKPGHHIGLTAFNGYIDGDFDSGSDPRVAHAITRQQAYTLTSTDDITDYWQSVLRFGLSKESNESRSYGGSFSFGSLQRSYSWQNNLKFSDNQNVSVILERLEERPASFSSYTTNRRDTNSAGLIYRGDFDAHHVQASIRNDNISNYGNQVTGGLGYDFDLNDQWTVGVAGNTGFRAPTFADLYYPFEQYYYDGWPSGSFQGNPNLKPEKSRNIEARLRYEDDTTRLGLVVYQNKIRDLINGYVCDFNFDCTANNTDRATIRGVTLTAQKDFGKTTVRASADFMDPRNDQPREGEGSVLVRRAKQVYLLGVDHRIDALTVGAEYQFIGKRYDDVANTRVMGGYSLLNLTAAYDFSKNVGVQVRWNNLLNKDYTNVYGYNMPGSNVFVNLSFRM
ncbi:TonB-dependent receptor [Candidimonas sp. SYP-B2681]|uniref:TonB-dependent receptor domain-containing protein n=1 Tax=Candidimonas sp. SYP-B2681 TaxID=2497686 RepID=UPI000F87FE83|nr:TonB-dependent receptor [Candidimonas sp. SYP-B2681]RTZ39755.1 TonB-dependent receptor [Candidimonas sp. SYP-B2681]